MRFFLFVFGLITGILNHNVSLSLNIVMNIRFYCSQDGYEPI